MSYSSGGGVYTADGKNINLVGNQFSLKGQKVVGIDVTSINGTTSCVAVAVAASARYSFYASLYVTGTGNNENFQLHALAAGASVVFIASRATINATAYATTTTGLISAVTTNINGGSAATNPIVFEIWGSILVGATATTIQLDLVDTGTLDTVKAGSYLQVFQTS